MYYFRRRCDVLEADTKDYSTNIIITQFEYILWPRISINKNNACLLRLCFHFSSVARTELWHMEHLASGKDILPTVQTLINQRATRPVSWSQSLFFYRILLSLDSRNCVIEQSLIHVSLTSTSRPSSDMLHTSNRGQVLTTATALR
jgi:hypothetical protein